MLQCNYFFLHIIPEIELISNYCIVKHFKYCMYWLNIFNLQPAKYNNLFSLPEGNMYCSPILVRTSENLIQSLISNNKQFILLWTSILRIYCNWWLIVFYSYILRIQRQNLQKPLKKALNWSDWAPTKFQ